MKTTIKYKSVLQGIKDIKERNEEFHKLSDEGKRLEIAWDALQLVLTRKVSAHDSGYWSDNLRHIQLENPELYQKEFLNLPPCQVCQRGLMMISTIRLGNRLTWSENIDCGASDLIQGFNMNNFRQMETEFEHSTYGHPYGTNTEEKLANICCNILVNGDFNIYDKTDYLV